MNKLNHALNKWVSKHTFKKGRAGSTKAAAVAAVFVGEVPNAQHNLLNTSLFVKQS